MSKIAIKVEHLSKLYRLGEVGTGTLSHDLNRWWAQVRGKEDPYAKVGQVNDRTQKAQKGEHVWALKDINFEVQQGEVLGIIGKNGAGKSTLLKLLSKITAPTTGCIKSRGRVASLLEVGTGMHPEMTGIENVYLNGTILGMNRREIKSKLDDILDFAGCAKYGDTPVKRYSSGMKVRLGFAVAAFLEPEILIVDEVLAVGDAEFQKRAIGKMQEVSQGGDRTVLFVSHNMVSVSELCDRALLLEHGIIKYEGDVNSTVNCYLQETGAQQLGTYKADANNHAVYLKEARLLNSASEHIGRLRFYEPFKIHMHWKNHGKIKSSAVFLRFYNDQNQFLFAINTLDSGVNIDSKGDHFLEVSIDNNVLAPGRYYINIGATQLPRSVIYKRDNFLWFEVDDASYDNKVNFKTKGGSPLISLKARWVKKQQLMVN